MTGRSRVPRAKPLPARPETIRTRAQRDAARRGSVVFLRGLQVDASIGVHPHERESRQLILVDVELDLGSLPPPRDDRLAETVDYQRLATAVTAMAREGHVQLVETLAHRIADWCLADPRVRGARVRIEKPAALAHAAAAGCDVTRRRDDL